MKNLFLTLTIGIALSISSCGDTSKKTDEGQIRKNEYTSKEIGWTIEIPEGWEVTDLEKTKKSSQKGEKAIEETINAEVDYSGLKHLITFQKNQFNIFQSSSEPFKLEYEGEWEETDCSLKAIVYDTYKNQGIKADSSATTIDKIDGLDFRTYSFTIYSPKGDVILKQIIYGRLINGFNFGVNINYNNEKDKDEMLKAFRKSKFNHRN
jgi:hypothetical protein